MSNINERIEGILDLTFHFVVWAVALITPLFFWNLTSEFYEIPKLIFLIVAIGIMIFLWIARYAISGKFSITRTPLDLPLFMLLVVLIISTFFAPAKSVAIFGNLPRVHGGLITYIAYILFYFVLVSNLKQINVVKQTIYLLLVSGVILSVLALFSYAGINLLFLPWTAALNFTPSGSTFTTAAILALLLPFPLMSILQNASHEIFGGSTTTANNNNQPGILASIFGDQDFLKDAAFSKELTKISFAAILTLFAVTIVLTGTILNIVIAAAAFILVLFVAPPLSIKKNLYFIFAPVLIAAAFFSLSALPVGGSKNFFLNQAQQFPREIQLPFTTSWKVSVSAFRDSPFWGTGPASYLFDFTAYKPADFNSSKFWNVRFDQAFNEYLQLLGTMGALGLIALLLLTTLFISFALKALTSSQSSIGVSLSISGITFFIILALHTSTLPLWIVGLIIIASFMAVYKNITKENHTNSSAQAIKTSVGGVSLNFNILPLIILLVITIGIGTVFYYAGRTVLADYHHRIALNAVAAGRGLEGYNELIAAEKLNPNIDLYHINLAQTNFALANAIATSKGPTEASPGGSLTDQDKQDIQTLLSQSINEGRIAVSISPNNTANWEILGSIYRQISGVAQNALSFALDSYGRAIEKDPLNPALRLSVGGIYYSAKNYDMAIRFFTDSINIKPDFANGYYNLGVALRDRGDLVSAAVSLEKTISLLDPKSTDYKAASDIYSNLKDQIASQSAAQKASQQAAPPLQNEPKNSSALQDKNLPKVLDLPKPEKVASPAAVKKPDQE